MWVCTFIRHWFWWYWLGNIYIDDLIMMIIARNTNQYLQKCINNWISDKSELLVYDLVSTNCIQYGNIPKRINWIMNEAINGAGGDGVYAACVDESKQYPIYVIIAAMLHQDLILYRKMIIACKWGLAIIISNIESGVSIQRIYGSSYNICI